MYYLIICCINRHYSGLNYAEKNDFLKIMNFGNLHTSLKLCLLATSMTRSIKAAATSYVVYVVKNIESNEQYFSAKRAVIKPPQY
jgi:hypothetical protein